jgi:hypothetical protein
MNKMSDGLMNDRSGLTPIGDEASVPFDRCGIPGGGSDV